MHICEINRFRSSHPGVFLKVGASKMNTKPGNDTCEELCNIVSCRHASLQK